MSGENKNLLTVKQILEVVAQYETYCFLDTNSNSGSPLAEKYFAAIGGQRQRVLEIYVDAKFKKTMDVLTPVMKKNKPEAKA